MSGYNLAREQVFGHSNTDHIDLNSVNEAAVESAI